MVIASTDAGHPIHDVHEYLVDNQGRRVNAHGYNINATGQRVNSHDEPINAAGARVNVDGNLIGPFGRLIVTAGTPDRLVHADGYQINAAGHPIDADGNPVNQHDQRVDVFEEFRHQLLQRGFRYF